MNRWRVGLDARLALVVAAACLIVIAVVPIALIAGELITDDALAVLSSTLGRSATWWLLLRSVALAMAVTLVTLAIGVPMGTLLARTDVAGRGAALLVHCAPICLPPFLLALGWFHIFGRQGTLGSAWTSNLLFGPLGVTLTLALAFSPVITALTALGLHAIDRSLEEAGRTAASPRRVVVRILLPLARPSIALGALIVFALALSEISVPMFLRVKTYPAAVFTRVGGMAYAPGEAVALVIPLLLVAMGLVALDRHWLGRRRIASYGARSRTLSPMPLGRWRLPATIAVWVAAILPIAPLVALANVASDGGFSSARWWMHDSLGTSLLVAAIAATVIVALGIVIGHSLARGISTASALDGVAALSFFVPSAVLGVGLIATWNRPTTQAVYTSSAILVLGLTAHYAILGTRTLTAAFGSSSAHYEEAAAASGAGYVRRMTRVVLPMHARGVIATWLLAFVFCLRDLDTVIVFYPPGLETLPVRIFTLEANGPAPVVAALSVIHVVITLAIGALAAVALRAGKRFE